MESCLVRITKGHTTAPELMGADFSRQTRATLLVIENAAVTCMRINVSMLPMAPLADSTQCVQRFCKFNAPWLATLRILSVVYCS
jgi:hypothetical protein